MHPQIVAGILNFVALVAFTGLSWHLFKASRANNFYSRILIDVQTYSQRTFERVHKRPEMNRLYIVSSAVLR